MFIFRKNKRQGATLVMAIVLLTIFLLMLGGVINLIMSQNKQTNRQISWERSLAIAEAGANYSRWHLVHDSNNYSFSGIYDYSDPQGGIIGQYSLEITEPPVCTTMVTVKSTGWTLDFPNITRTIQVRYNRASLAQYAFLTNSDIWIGENEDVQGPFHSNGGIRMDGTQNAESTSAKETYICQPMHGCNPAQEKPGVWGSGAGGSQGLWRFPVSTVDFNVITTNLAELRTKAINGGYYIEPSGTYGYHITFKNTGAFDLYKVTQLQPDVWGCDTQGNCGWESNDIRREEFIDRYDLAVDQCDVQNLIFVEDKKVWVDGVLKEKATVAAAQFPDSADTNSSIIINGNLTRANPMDTMLGLIAQKNILVPYYSLNILEIQAVMVAQKGAVQRYYYPGNIKNRIMVRGSIITNNVWTWSWVNGSGTVVSGYQNTESYFEPALIYAPPPFFPGTGEYTFISWEELF